MATTANHGFPTPDFTDQPNVPTHMKALADAIDAYLADTGWQTCVLSSGFSGTVKVKRVGSAVFGKIAVNVNAGTWPTTQTDLFTLPNTSYASPDPARPALGGGSSNTGNLVLNATVGGVTVTAWANGSVAAGMYYNGPLWRTD